MRQTEELGLNIIEENDSLDYSPLNENFEKIDKMGSGIPRGCILIWSGSATNVPSGWALCNGENGTPDLRGRFVLHPETELTKEELLKRSKILNLFREKQGNEVSVARCNLRFKKEISSLVIKYEYDGYSTSSNSHYLQVTLNDTMKASKLLNGIGNSEIVIDNIAAGDELKLSNGFVAFGYNLDHYLKLRVIIEFDDVINNIGDFTLEPEGFLLNDNMVIHSIDGERRHKISIPELPSHQHKQQISAQIPNTSPVSYMTYPWQYLANNDNIHDTVQSVITSQHGTRINTRQGYGFVETSKVGKSTDYNSMPPYYALCYIMKV